MNKKRVVSLLLAVWLLWAFLPVQALAAGVIDQKKDTSLTISYQDGDTPIAGAGFTAYLVATVDKNGELTPTAAFRQFDVEIRGENDDAWRALTATLEGHVLLSGTTPTATGKTDEKGVLKFQDMPQGLYFVMGDYHTQNGYLYTTESFLTLLPGRDAQTDEWVYHVTVYPKHERDVDPDAITRKVLKVWDDEGRESDRPEEITVHLMKDGVVVDTVKLSAENSWRYTWENLDGKFRWSVAEEPVEKYTVKITLEGVTYVITNSHIDPPPPTEEPPEKLPQTGQLWWPVPVLVVSGLLLIVIGLIRRRGDEYES